MLKIISFLLFSLAMVNAVSIGDTDEALSVLEDVGHVSKEDQADLATALALVKVSPQLIENDAAITALSKAWPAIATQSGNLKNHLLNLVNWLKIIRNVKTRQERNLGARSMSDSVEQVHDQEDQGDQGDLRRAVGDVLQVDTEQMEDMAETQADVIQKMSWCILCLRCPFRLCQACLICKN